MRRTLLRLVVVAVMVVMVVGTAVPAFANPSGEQDRCSKFSEGFIVDCRGGSGGGGSIDADEDGTPDGGGGGSGLAGLHAYDQFCDPGCPTIDSGGSGRGSSDPDFLGLEANGGSGHHCTGDSLDVTVGECFGGGAPGV